MKVNQVLSKIYHLKFDTQYEICSTLFRFQEFYQSPYKEIKGKYFSAAKFKEVYKKYNKGKYTYNKKWVGFNFPSEILKPFYEGKFPELSDKEREILNYFSNIKGKFYIIGTYTNSSLSHEIAHALFYINESYKKEVLKELNNIDITYWKDEIREFGYAEDVLIDEIHAYMMEPDSYLKAWFKDKEFDKKLKEYKEVRKNMKKIYKRYTR